MTVTHGVTETPDNTTNFLPPRPSAKLYWWLVLLVPFGWVVLPPTWGQILVMKARNRGHKIGRLFNLYMLPFWIGTLLVATLFGGSLAIGRYADSHAPKPYIEGAGTQTQPATGGGGGAVPAPIPAQPAGTDKCIYLGYGDGDVKQSDLPPMSNVPNTGTATATLTTSLGDIVIELDQAKAPCAVNSLRYLTNRGYFNDTSCHRFANASGFHILQCGDPFGTGLGGPGYRFTAENPPTTNLPAGTVVMAGASPDSRGNIYSGSQFVIVYSDTQLSDGYGSVIGHVTQGLELVQRAAAQGATPDGTPKQAVTLNQVTVG